MYDEDAAVGKIDSYVISVAGAGRLIGEERLVRITEVGRTSAARGDRRRRRRPPDEGEDGEKPQRRRGRRGGRGRKRASASS